MTPADGLGEVLDASDSRAVGSSGRITITLKIRRYNPEVRGEESWWDEFTIETDPDDRLLDALHQVKWYHDGTPVRAVEHVAQGLSARRA